MKSRIIGIVILVACVLSGCFFVTKGPYTFRQEFDQIVKIEILEKEQDLSDLSDYDPARVKVLKTLDITEHRAFIDDLLKVEGSRVGLDPATGFGDHIIRITYRNGEIELIGAYNNGYIPTDGRLRSDCYGMNKEQFYDLLSRVLGEEITEPTWG